MSIQKRKIAYHLINFMDGDSPCFDNELFFRFIDFLSGLSEPDKIFRDTKNNKAVSVSSIERMDKEGMNFVKIVFKSCKYNHNPDYMSSVDGTERPTSKQSYEGDKELTHMMMRVDGNNAFTIFEERRSGVTIGGVIKYLNHVLFEFYRIKHISSNWILWSGNVPSDDFLTALDKSRRIKAANLYISKSILGESGLNLLNDRDFSCREEVVITMKAEPRDTLPTRFFRGLYTAIAASQTNIERIVLYGKNIDNMDVTLDSLEKKKVCEIIVELLPNGTVDSYSIFAKMEELFGVTE